MGALQCSGEEVNEGEGIDEAVGKIQRPASEKQAVFRKRSRKRKRWGEGNEKESASNPPYPVQNDKDINLSGTPPSAAYAAQISLAIIVAKETVLENRGKKHSPEDQAPTVAASLLMTSAPVNKALARPRPHRAKIASS